GGGRSRAGGPGRGCRAGSAIHCRYDDERDQLLERHRVRKVPSRDVPWVVPPVVLETRHEPGVEPIGQGPASVRSRGDADEMLLETIHRPADLRGLDRDELTTLATEIRSFIVQATSVTGGHLGSNLGVVELTLALHRVFDSPRDILLWDTGHQAYVHKILTGRRDQFDTLRQAGGLSG